MAEMKPVTFEMQGVNEALHTINLIQERIEEIKELLKDLEDTDISLQLAEKGEYTNVTNTDYRQKR